MVPGRQPDWISIRIKDFLPGGRQTWKEGMLLMSEFDILYPFTVRPLTSHWWSWKLVLMETWQKSEQDVVTVRPIVVEIFLSGHDLHYFLFLCVNDTHIQQSQLSVSSSSDSLLCLTSCSYTGPLPFLLFHVGLSPLCLFFSSCCWLQCCCFWRLFTPSSDGDTCGEKKKGFPLCVLMWKIWKKKSTLLLNCCRAKHVVCGMDNFYSFRGKTQQLIHNTF